MNLFRNEKYGNLERVFNPASPDFRFIAPPLSYLGTTLTSLQIHVYITIFKTNQYVNPVISVIEDNKEFICLYNQWAQFGRIIFVYISTCTIYLKSYNNKIKKTYLFVKNIINAWADRQNTFWFLAYRKMTRSLRVSTPFNL